MVVRNTNTQLADQSEATKLLGAKLMFVLIAFYLYGAGINVAVARALHAGPHVGWPFGLWIIVINSVILVGLLPFLFITPKATRWTNLICTCWYIVLLISGGYVISRCVRKVMTTPARLARAGDVVSLEWYAALGLDLNQPEWKTHQTPLIAAINAHQTATVKRLLELGEDVHTPDSKGATSLSLALNTNQPEIAAFLRQHGATH